MSSSAAAASADESNSLLAADALDSQRIEYSAQLRAQEDLELSASESESPDTEPDLHTHSRSTYEYLSPSPIAPTFTRLNNATSVPPPQPSPPPPVDLSAMGVWRCTLAAISNNHSIQSAQGSARMAFLALGLGIAIGVGSQWVLWGGGTWWRQFGLYLFMLALFHLLEFTWTAIFHPNKLSSQAFLLNHSREYHFALLAGVIEFILETLLFPSWKYPSSSFFMWFGFLLTAGGQIARTLAMLTAADNFTHIVADHRAANHQLVTHGIYGLCRHPSYAGWFWWSVGTQILLCNPICTVAYAAASWLFFRGRIAYEERALVRFFGQQYVNYQQRVTSGVPFIKGCVEDAARA